jgi:hypothetical protein
MPLLAVLCLLVFAVSASADPSDDYRSVHRDWEADGNIAPCHWTVEQLQNARAIADSNPDDTYNGFPDRVDEEIARWRRGDCAPRLKIVAVRAKRERVAITNVGGSPAPVTGVRLRDRQGNTIRLPRGFELPVRDTLVVRSRRRAIWDDRGDVARLVAKDGSVVSRYGYGRFRNVKRF